MYDFCIIFFLFFSLSFIGYIVEVIYCSIISKKLILNRGFLIGPYLPIYGISSVIMAAMLSKYKNDPLVIFVLSATIATIVEYLTSYLMEKMFKTRWWDYTNEPYNVNGRVCLKNSFLFGIGGLLVVYLVDNYYLNLIYKIDSTIFIAVTIVLMVVFLTDLVVSNLVVFKIRKNSILAKFDMTEEVKENVKRELSKNITLTKRLLSSFPDVFDNIRETIKKIDEKRKKVEKENKEKIKKMIKK